MIVVHYGELFTKGRNRPVFQRQLQRNLENATDVKAKLVEHRFFLDADASALPKIEKVFGVSWFAECLDAKRSLSGMEDAVARLAESAGGPVKVEVNRSDKSFEFQSPEIVRQLTRRLEKRGVALAVKNPKAVVHVDVLRDKAVAYGGKHAGLGGLPVGVSGKVVTLLSGGFDSPVAAWLMAKRGIKNVYVHFHPHRENVEEKSLKILNLARQLKPWTLANTVYLVPYNEFTLAALDVPERFALPVFRRFMARVAQQIAVQENAEGIATGENLAQVSSQTLSNLGSIQDAVKLPMLRPLLTYDKKEIIGIAEKIGTYDLSRQPYLDCCQSLVSRHPATRTDARHLEKLEERLPDGLVDQTLNQALRVTA
ncbi:tRNA 4-thiouridine(8) synthase ThiI [Candidatus Micrarchaeota archaeon]|nr:tRNA 4-thiouridine(8) synthase ThiI [Candidatus Micrarchaeota archaeon]